MHKFQDYDSAFQTAICEGRHFIKFEKHLHDHILTQRSVWTKAGE